MSGFFRRWWENILLVGILVGILGGVVVAGALGIWLFLHWGIIPTVVYGLLLLTALFALEPRDDVWYWY